MAGDKIIDKLHFEACKKREESYIDPASGYRVFTSLFLDKREDCCGCACRHCPFEYENVEKGMRKNLLLDPYFYNLSLKPEMDVLFWSGGKDSFLALNELRKENKRPVLLLTAYDGVSQQVTHQEIKIKDIKQQALKMGCSILFVPLYGSCSYKERIDLALARILTKTRIRRVVFGDLHLQNIRTWREENFKSYIESFEARMYFPLWNKSYEYLLDCLEETKAKVYLSASECEKLKTTYKVGDEFNRKFFNALEDSVDAFGEEGEFHTIVEPPQDFMK